MKDNKVEYIITNEHPHRKEIIDQFLDIPIKWDSMREDLSYYFLVDLKTKDVVKETYEEYKQRELKKSQDVKQSFADAHGNDFGGKRIKFTMEVMDIEHEIEAEA